jgi:hypothetical protein
VEWKAYLHNRPIALGQNAIRRSDIAKRLRCVCVRADRRVDEDVEQAVYEFERRWVVADEEGFAKLQT